MNKFIAGAVLTVAVVGGAVWKFSGEGPTETSVTGLSTVELASHSDHLALIPSDTLFYMGSLEPIPAKDMMGSMSSMFQFVDPSIQPTMDEFFSKADSAGGKIAISLFNFFMTGPRFGVGRPRRDSWR